MPKADKGVNTEQPSCPTIVMQTTRSAAIGLGWAWDHQFKDWTRPFLTQVSDFHSSSSSNKQSEESFE